MGKIELMICYAMYPYMVDSVADLFYGGEVAASDQPQAYACPFCSKQGFTESTLQEHVLAEHADATNEVVRDPNSSVHRVVDHI